MREPKYLGDMSRAAARQTLRDLVSQGRPLFERKARLEGFHRKIARLKGGCPLHSDYYFNGGLFSLEKSLGVEAAMDSDEV